METAQSPEIITDPVHETTCLKCHHLMDVSGLPAFLHIACPECGTQQSVPAKMGAFLLVELLGKGGMGAVYRGRDTGLDRWVAVKVMQSTFGGNPEFVETFRNEAQAAAALNHPNIVQIYSFGVAHGQPYMAMELLEGGRMDQMIAKGEPLNEALVLKICADVAEGLNAAAAINLIHGDVKPENILLDHNGIAKVVDFGLARFKEKSEGGPSKGIWGTPYYIAPEKLRGHVSDVRSDIYSLGGTMFHALALKPPFDGETPMDVIKARLKAPAPMLRTLRPDVSPEVEAIVARMLESDPLRRYPNYGSVLSDLRRVLSTMAPPPTVMFGQPSKKSGKFVLAKRKSSGMVPSSISSGPVLPGAAATVESTPLPGTKPKAKGNGSRVVLWLLLGVLALGGLIGGYVASQKSGEQRQVEKKEHDKLAKYRRNADLIWTDLQTLRSDVSNQLAEAQGMSSNIAGVAFRMAATTPAGTEEGEIAKAKTTVAAFLKVVEQYSNSLVSAQTQLTQLSEQTSSNRQVLLSLTNSAAAGVRFAMMTNVTARQAELIVPVTAAAGKSRKAMEDLAALQQKFQKSLKAAAEAAKQAAVERAEAARVQAAKQAAEQEAAEKAARIQTELKTLEDTRTAAGTFVQQHQFKPALEMVEQAARGLHTAEGKAAGKQVVKAYQMLVDLKALIVAGVKAEVEANPDSGYAFGWLGAKDILRVTEEKVVIRGEQVFPWSEVPPKQMVRFIQRFVDNNTELTRREKATYDFAVALYFNDAKVGDEKSRMKEVARYLSEAIHGNSSLEEMARSVLPGVESK